MRCLAVLALTLSLAPAFAKTKGEDSAKRSFEDLRPLLFQIKTAAEAGAEKSSYGTGFVVDRRGWIVTNFHVVADAVWKPKKNKIFAVMAGEDVPAQILSVDIVHDLALLKVPREMPAVLKISNDVPRNGETLHSMGLPEDLDWTVVNGVSNGVVEQGPYRLIHMSSPINRGMSGGPTVNTRQELVGVNVSGQIFSQAISFAVPAEYVRKLVDRVRARDGAGEEPLKDIETDVQGLEKGLSQIFEKGLKSAKELGGWRLPKFPRSVRCWGSEGGSDERDYESRSEMCKVDHHLFIDGERFFGMFRLEIETFEGKKLNSFAWRSLRNGNWQRLQLDQKSPIDKESAINFGKVSCEASLVREADGERRIRVCSQRILPFKDLHEAEIVLEVPNGDRRVLQFSATLSGFHRDSIEDIVKMLLHRQFRGAPRAAN